MGTNVFPTGTKTIFQQTAAPTGWTKDTTYDDYALRVVSGTTSIGGSIAFSTVFNATGKNFPGTYSVTTPGSTAAGLAIAGPHTHPSAGGDLFGSSTLRPARYNPAGPQNAHTAVNLPNTATPVGGGSPHTHPLTIGVPYSPTPASFNVAYVDVIIATIN